MRRDRLNLTGYRRRGDEASGFRYHLPLKDTVAYRHYRTGRSADMLGYRIYQIPFGFYFDNGLLFCQALAVIRMNTTLKS